MNISDLKSRKKAIKLTTNDLAIEAGIPYSTLSKVFTGETRNPSYTIIERIDQILWKYETQARIKAYCDAMEEYILKHPDELFDEKKFEIKYRKDRKLNDAPIPYALPRGDNLAKSYLALKYSNLISVKEFIKMEVDENRRAELIDGNVIYSESPGFRHQLLADGIGDALKEYIKENKGDCKAFSSGINVQLDENEDTVVIPDVLLLCDSSKITEFGILGAPDFIVEITSPGSRRRDYLTKMNKYMAAGVREYWIVDLQKNLVSTYTNEMPMITGIYQFSDEVPVGIYDGNLRISIDRILNL